MSFLKLKGTKYYIRIGSGFGGCGYGSGMTKNVGSEYGFKSIRSHNPSLNK
jgi:hypothetical protein